MIELDRRRRRAGEELPVRSVHGRQHRDRGAQRAPRNRRGRNKRAAPTRWSPSPRAPQAASTSAAGSAAASGPSTPYRLFNGRTDANHRFTTDLAVRTQIIGKGYVPEGYGPQGVALCALA
jgi:hypothetical protein